MIILNFSHPLTSAQFAQLESLAQENAMRVFDLPVQFDNQQPYLPQLQALMERIPLSTEELQTLPVLVNPPSYNFITALLLAELHGRMGYFPPVIRIRPVEGSLPPRFEVAEILNLQAVREQARLTRGRE
jgi:hypothetical protein